MADTILTAAFLAGIGLFAYGAWLAWHPAGFIVAGVLLIVVPVIYTRGKWASSIG